jgi:hypothetical protein
MAIKADTRQIFSTAGRAFALAYVALLSDGYARAQDVVWPQAQETGVAVGEKAPVELKLSAPVTAVLCVGGTLVLELEVRNISEKALEFDKSALWKNYTYVFYEPEGFGQGGGRGVSCTHCLVEREVLLPGLVYFDKHEFSLKDEFFRKAGNYDIGVFFDNTGRFMSNRLKFELMDCGHTESR